MTVRSPIPLYILIADAIRRRIESGEYDVGRALPTENVLAVEFDVSRPTVRQALNELVMEGLIDRKRGRGTFVVPPEHHHVGQRFKGSLRDLIAETRRTGVRDIAIKRNTPIPERFAKLLELDRPVGTIVRRTRTWDDRPFAFTVNYLSQEYGQLLSETELQTSSLMEILVNNGVEFTEARQSVRAQMADPNLTDKLGLSYMGAPVLFVQRLVNGSGGHPVELVQTWYRGDAYEYTVTFDLDGPQRNQAIDGLA